MSSSTPITSTIQSAVNSVVSDDQMQVDSSVASFTDSLSISSEASASMTPLAIPGESSVPPSSSSLEGMNQAIASMRDRLVSLSVALLSSSSGSESDQALRTSYNNCAADLKVLISTRDMLSKSDSQLSLSSSSWPVVPSKPSATSLKVPPNLPLMQWKGAVFDSSATASDDAKHCLQKFQDIMSSHGLSFDHHWLRLLPPCLSAAQRAWLDEYQTKEPVLTWEKFKLAFIDKYGVAPSEERANSASELLSISMAPSETLEKYADRFTNLRRLARITDSVVLIRCFLFGLPYDFHSKVIVALANDSDSKKESIDHVIRLAKSLHNDLSTLRRPKSSSDDASKKRPGASPRTSPYPKPGKKFCSFHNTSSHSNSECRALKKDKAASAANNVGGTSESRWNPANSKARLPSGTGRPCRSCGSPWRIGHRCQQTSEPVDVPQAAFRAMSISPTLDASTSSSSDGTPVNASSPSGNSSADATVASPSGSSSSLAVSLPTEHMEIDQNQANAVSMAEAAQACKYLIHPTYSIAPRDTNTIYVPIIVERIKTWAMIDTGATFSCVSPAFCSALGLAPSPPKQGTIRLGHNDSKVLSRLGEIKLHVLYNLIHLSYVFEVFDFRSDVPICLGLDILPKLRIGLTGLATSWLSSNNPKIPDAVDPDQYRPNETPVGTPQERKHLMSILQPLLEENSKIPMSSHCNLPGAIITLDTDPNAFAFRRQYDIPLAYEKLLDEQVQTWLNDHVIEPAPANTRFNNPVLFVGKKDIHGQYTKKRAVIDPRLLNSIVKNVDRMPLPLISDLHQRMGSSTIFTTFDIKQCFHRFLIKESDRPKTAFTVPRTGMQYQFRHCPFGLTSTGNIVQRVLTNLFADLPYTALYIDDLCVFSSGSMAQHTEYVREVLRRLTAANLIINVEKTHFAQSCVNILGWTIGRNGQLIPDQRKLSNIHTWPTPTSGKQVMSFLGFANYFRNSIPMFSRLTAPLDRLRSSGSLKGIWNDTHAQTFDNIKNALINAPVINIPDLKYRFYVATDASAYGIGGVIYQVINDEIKYNAFAARALTATERRYPTNKRELLAIVYMFNKFHKWLYNRPFTLATDHKSLIYIHTQVIPNATMLNWFEYLFEYTYDIVHCPGIKNVIPDALSRLFPDEHLEGGNNAVNTDINNSKSKTKGKSTLSKNSKGNDMRNPTPINKPMLHRALQYEDYITPPPEERHNIILRAHLLGHFGVKAVEQSIHGDNLHWTNIRQDIQDVISQCHECQLFNIAKTGYHPPKSILPDGPLDHWCMDLGTFNVTSTSGNNFVLVMVDLYSRFTILRAIQDKQALTIANELIQIFCTFGWPKVIASDNGKEFTATIVTQMINHLGVDKRLSNPFNPLGNSVNEAFVGIAKRTIIKQLQGRKEEWDLYLPITQYAMNLKYSRLHKSRPYTVIFNKVPNDMKDYSHIKPTLRSEAVDAKMIEQKFKYVNEVVIPALSKRIKETQEADNAYFMKKNKIVHNPFPIHSEVMIKNVTRESKTDPVYEGPFYISGLTKNGSYILVDKQNNLLSRDVPTSHIKLITPPSGKGVVSELHNEQDEHYEVQAIIQHRGTPGNYEYLIHWKGYDDPEDNTWEPSSHIDDPKIIETYWARRNAGNSVSKRAALPKRIIPTRDTHSRNKRSRR